MPFSSRDTFLKKTRDQKKGSFRVTLFAAITFIVATSLALSRIPIRDSGRAQNLRINIKGPAGVRMDQAFRTQLIIILNDDRYKPTLNNDLMFDLRHAVLKNEMLPEHFEIANRLKSANNACLQDPNPDIAACFSNAINTNPYVNDASTTI